MLMQIMVDYHTPMIQKGKIYLKYNKNKIKRINLLINQKFYANAIDTCT